MSIHDHMSIGTYENRNRTLTRRAREVGRFIFVAFDILESFQMFVTSGGLLEYVQLPYKLKDLLQDLRVSKTVMQEDHSLHRDR